MGLIVLVFLGLIVSVLLMISFIKKKESHTQILLKVSLTETATVFFILVSLLILYHDIPHTNFIISKLFLSGMVIISFFVFDLTVKMPRFEVKKRGCLQYPKRHYSHSRYSGSFNFYLRFYVEYAYRF